MMSLLIWVRYAAKPGNFTSWGLGKGYNEVGENGPVAVEVLQFEFKERDQSYYSYREVVTALSLSSLLIISSQNSL